MFRSLILAAVLLACAPVIANAGEITLLPSVKLQIGDRDGYGNYWRLSRRLERSSWRLGPRPGRRTWSRPRAPLIDKGSASSLFCCRINLMLNQ